MSGPPKKADLEKKDRYQWLALKAERRKRGKCTSILEKRKTLPQKSEMIGVSLNTKKSLICVQYLRLYDRLGGREERGDLLEDRNCPDRKQKIGPKVVGPKGERDELGATGQECEG